MFFNNKNKQIFIVIFLSLSSFPFYTIGQTLPKYSKEASFYHMLQDCFDSDDAVLNCLKSQLVFFLDDTLAKDVLPLINGISLKKIKKVPQFTETLSLDNLPRDFEHRERALDSMIWNRVKYFFQTRTIDFPYIKSDDFSGRKKNKGLSGALLYAGIMKLMMFGAMAFKFIGLIAVKAIFVSKIALVISSLIALKKLASHEEHHTEIHKARMSRMSRMIDDHFINNIPSIH